MKKHLLIVCTLLFLYPIFSISVANGFPYRNSCASKPPPHYKSSKSNKKSQKSQKSNFYQSKSYPTKYRPIPFYQSPSAKRKSITSNSYKPELEKNVATESDLNSKKIGYYFRLYNENVGALGCNMKFYERDVSQELKEKARHRDANRCVICGSKEKLEIDHRRALINGGNNSLGNLGTLCEDCHTEKTRMDNSLRQKREKICRN